jgi:hypothetical protein
VSPAEKRLAEGLVVSCSPEAQLRFLFRREAEIERERAGLSREINRERRRYADKHGLITPPRLERLRTEFGK